MSQSRRREADLKPTQSESGLFLGMGAGPSALAPLQGLDQRLFPTGFERWRSELDHLSGMNLLNALTEPMNAAACVQTLPVEDLHRYLFEIGLEDAESVLALASGEQVKALLDIEIWDQHELNPLRLDAWMFALLRAGKDVLYQRVLELDDSLLAWLMKSNAYAFVIEDPEDFDPPNAEHFLTPDRRFCIVFPRSSDHLEDKEKQALEAAVGLPSMLNSEAPLGGGAKDKPARVFIDMLMQEQPEFCIHLLLASTAALYTQIHEDAYRWRSARMSDLGFVSYEEARQIYMPPPQDWKAHLPAQRVDEDQTPAKKWLAQIIAPNQRLDQAFAALSWDDAILIAEQLGYVANMALSADKVALWDQEQQKTTLQRLQAGLNIALELLNGPQASPVADAESLAQHHVNHLFRLGYEQMLEAARPLWRVESMIKREDDPSALLSALPTLKTWTDALLADHPHARGETGEIKPLNTLSECKVARAAAEMIEDLVKVSQKFYAELLEQIANAAIDSEQAQVDLGPLLLAAYARDEVLNVPNSQLRPLTGSEIQRVHAHFFVAISESDLQPENSLEANLEQEKQALEQASALFDTLRKDARANMSKWWQRQGGQTATAPLALLRELEEQMAKVDTDALDSRFIPLLWSHS